jgi:2-keto-4-pentenoate hydratase/2-oxohepta-3-ene-1,7-dioic acid hydratase in catechol pathway
VQEPTILSKFTSCTVASIDPILLSPEASELDFEVELVIVIGKHACQK